MGAALAATGVSMRPSSESGQGDWALLGGLSFLLSSVHMLVGGRYGYFVDELYYLARSHHLDFLPRSKRPKKTSQKSTESTSATHELFHRHALRLWRAQWLAVRRPRNTKPRPCATG
jgi:hypothetical protein